MRLKQKVAVVTGAASGFGRGIAEAFVKEGARVVVADINETGSQEVASALGQSALAWRCDVTSADDVARLIGVAEKEFGPVDIMVNNAGITHANQPLMNVGEDEFDAIYSVNVKSIYLTTKAVVPTMRGRGGSIINVASTAGVRPRPGLTWYNGSKGAAITLTKSLAVELAPDNIRVNAINPVMGETGMLEKFMGLPDTPENREKFVSGIPLGRMSQPEDIANAAVFFADPASEFVTGVAMEIDGGRCV
ncbi:MAG: glucose 1-dehydrogenase [Hyphomicrobiaceae bacterium]